MQWNLRGVWMSFAATTRRGSCGQLSILCCLMESPGCWAVTSLAEAQVMRLAAIYALVDRSPLIQAAHLQAGLALWQYCEDSARYIFGAATGGVVADKILEALKGTPEGLTRTSIRDLFQRHPSAERLSNALALLQRTKKATMVKEETDGRPRERWFAVRECAKSAVRGGL
jgi:hypothetical protein